MHRRTLHGSGLHHAVVLARGFHHLPAFFDRYADGLFHVHVLAGLARFHGHVGVPVVRRRDVHDIDGLVRQDLAKIVDRARTVPFFAGLGHGVVQVRLVDVADRHHLQIGLPHGVIQVARAHAPHADKRGGHAIVGAPDVAGEKGSGQRHPRRFEKLPAACVGIFHAVLPPCGFYHRPIKCYPAGAFIFGHRILESHPWVAQDADVKCPATGISGVTAGQC
jgi:hypothetical protein